MPLLFIGDTIRKGGGISLSAQGSVIVRVFTSDAYIPIPNAPVVFTQVKPNGTQSLLAVRLTDLSGLTSAVMIDTPNESQSQTPGLSANPYALLNITVSYPGYQSVLAEDVEVFSGVETIQNIRMIPETASEFGTFLPSPPQSSQNL